MKRLLPTVLFTSLCFSSIGAAGLHAQFSFTALEGLPAAQSSATTALGSDATLVLVGAPGAFEYQGFDLSFDIGTGTSNVWGYVFHSDASGEFATFIVVRVFVYQAFELGSLPFPLPGGLDAELDVSGTYADSDDMVARLETDTAYLNYRQDLPGAAPQFLSLSRLLNTDSLELPNGFPVGQGTWTVSFSGGGDSTMTCCVASKTGEAFCRRIYGLPTSSVKEGEGIAEKSMHVLPNPVRDRVTVRIGGYASTDLVGSRLLLCNVNGETVRDLSESFRAYGNGEAEFSVADLPSGLYHCLLIGKDFHREAGIVVID